MDEDEVYDPANAPGPITDAYLQRDIHPDNLPGTKPAHYGPSELGGNPFPKSGAEEPPHPCEDTWLYH